MHWNYRLMAQQGEDEIYIKIHEVHYDENDIPRMYSANAASIAGENINEIKWSLQRMKECLSKSIIWADERFPDSYNSDSNKPKDTDDYYIDTLRGRVDEIRSNLSKRTTRMDELMATIDDAFRKYDQSMDSE